MTDERKAQIEKMKNERIKDLEPLYSDQPEQMDRLIQSLGLSKAGPMLLAEDGESVGYLFSTGEVEPRYTVHSRLHHLEIVLALAKLTATFKIRHFTGYKI